MVPRQTDVRGCAVVAVRTIPLHRITGLVRTNKRTLQLLVALILEELLHRLLVLHPALVLLQQPIDDGWEGIGEGVLTLPSTSIHPASQPIDLP